MSTRGTLDESVLNLKKVQKFEEKNVQIQHYSKSELLNQVKLRIIIIYLI